MDAEIGSTLMRRKRLYLLIVMVLLVSIWGVFLSFQSTLTDPILNAKFDSVELGISLDDATAILGRPKYLARSPLRENEVAQEGLAIWESDVAFIRLSLDKHGRVVDKQFGPRSLVSRFRDRW
jgi:hypothetical protein